MATTNLLDDPGHVRGDLIMMGNAVGKAIKHPEIPIPQAVIDAMPKVVSNMMLRSEDERIRCRASELMLKFMQYNVSIADQPTQQVEHHHTHELGPITADNFAESKRQLAARIARLG